MRQECIYLRGEPMRTKKNFTKEGEETMNILAIAEPAGGMNMMFIIAIYAVVLGGGYFLLMRPQKKEQKRVQAMISELETGDTVLTTSGFYGVVIDVTEEDVVVEFGSNKNCRIPMRKEAIAQVEKPE